MDEPQRTQVADAAFRGFGFKPWFKLTAAKRLCHICTYIWTCLLDLAGHISSIQNRHHVASSEDGRHRKRSQKKTPWGNNKYNRPRNASVSISSGIHVKLREPPWRAKTTLNCFAPRVYLQCYHTERTHHGTSQQVPPSTRKLSDSSDNRAWPTKPNKKLTSRHTDTLKHTFQIVSIVAGIESETGCRFIQCINQTESSDAIGLNWKPRLPNISIQLCPFTNLLPNLLLICKENTSKRPRQT